MGHRPWVRNAQLYNKAQSAINQQTKMTTLFLKYDVIPLRLFEDDINVFSFARGLHIFRDSDLLSFLAPGVHLMVSIT